MRKYEKIAIYAEMRSHYIMLQADAQQEHERYIIMLAALDPEDKEEQHELSHKAAEAFGDVLRYERALMYIDELREIETGDGSLMWLEKSRLNSLYGMMVEHEERKE